MKPTQPRRPQTRSEKNQRRKRVSEFRLDQRLKQQRKKKAQGSPKIKQARSRISRRPIILHSSKGRTSSAIRSSTRDRQNNVPSAQDLLNFLRIHQSQPLLHHRLPTRKLLTRISRLRIPLTNTRIRPQRHSSIGGISRPWTLRLRFRLRSASIARVSGLRVAATPQAYGGAVVVVDEAEVEEERAVCVSVSWLRWLRLAGPCGAAGGV